MSSDGDASSQQIVASESLFIVFINTDSYAYSLLLFLKKKAMKPNKLARVSFVKKKKNKQKNTMMERERPIASVSPFFLPVSAFIFYHHMHLVCGDCTHRIRYDS